MKNVKPQDIKRDWHLVDATSQILGRLSSQVATRLMGKNKNYYHHSGYPGGLYVKTAAHLRSNKPEFLIRNAVRGMLPKTTLGKQMLKKLYVYAGSEHAHKDKFVKDGQR